jgi:hypothetical protein
MSGDNLPVYSVRARNTSADSENRMHDDGVAASYGFRGGLVPGVTVYAYMTVPIVDRYGMDYLERGSIEVRFHQPFYEGDAVTVRAEAGETSGGVQITVTAEREDGAVCATGHARVGDRRDRAADVRIEDYPRAALPAPGERPLASAENILPGAVLGAVIERIDQAQSDLLEKIEDPLPIYYGEDGIAHPAVLLAMSNNILMHNFRLGPWIHAASDLMNLGAARAGEVIEARGRIRECFERKGHQFAVADVLLVTEGGRIIQHVRHTAIYNPRKA